MSPLTETVTFLMTDIAGSTSLWQQHPDAMHAVLARHDALADEIVARHNGRVLKHRGEGDSLFIVFPRATDAVAAACTLQFAYHSERWSEGIPLQVRMALHTGEAELRDNDYFGLAVSRCARLRAIAHGGQILVSQATMGLTQDSLPADARLQDCGRHRLRDLQRPEQVFQLSHSSLPDEFPPLKSLEAFAHNLPVQLNSFIGRAQEIQEIERLLAGTRVLTLKGTGGCGKTRLALQVAANLLEEYPDGVWFVELAPLSEPERIPQAVATALHVREASGTPLLETLADALAGKALLLVLDNCEHLIKACAHAAETLLRACPAMRILATSREPLTLAGEAIWEVSPLARPDPRNLLALEDLMQIEAVCLFLDRARAARPRFVMTPKNAFAIANICHRLDGLPLAIELAAAKVAMFTVEEIDELLFSLLDEAPSTAPDRHQTVQALMDWSYHLLPPPEQTLLGRLSVFAGGWTRQTAQDVCSDSGIPSVHVTKLLARLLRASLVVAEEQDEGMRYRMLETVSAYAAEKLHISGEETAVQDRHVHHFLEFAEEAEPYLMRKEQAVWRRRLEAENENLRAALTWAIDPELRLRLAGALSRFWSRQSYFTEGRAWLQGALARRGTSSQIACAKALSGLGVLIWHQGGFASAHSLLKESMSLYRAAGDEAGESEALNNLATVARDSGDIGEARACYEQSLAIKRKLGEKWGIAAVLNNLGILTRDAREELRARAYFEEALALYHELEDTMQGVIVSNNLAILALDQRDYVTARDHFQECLAFFRSIGHRAVIAIITHNIALTIHKLEGHAAAYPLFVESLLLKQELGDLVGIAHTLASLGEVARDAGNVADAAHLFGAVIALREAANAPLSEADQATFDLEMAPVRAAMGDEAFEKAIAGGRMMELADVMTYATTACIS